MSSKKKKKVSNYRNLTYYRKGRFSIDFVLNNTVMVNRDEEGKFVKGRVNINVAGVNVYMDSQRYKLFKQKGIRCVKCGIVGSHFYLERSRNKCDNPNRFHFNLYALDKHCNEVLMTKDHIVPKSKGGNNRLVNLQPMCAKCNCKKDNKMPKMVPKNATKRRK